MRVFWFKPSYLTIDFVEMERCHYGIKDQVLLQHATVSLLY